MITKPVPKEISEFLTNIKIKNPMLEDCRFIYRDNLENETFVYGNVPLTEEYLLSLTHKSYPNERFYVRSEEDDPHANNMHILELSGLCKRVLGKKLKRLHSCAAGGFCW